MVQYIVKNRVAHITLNRPDKRNALNAELVVALQAAFEQARTDKDAKVIVLAAKGKVFSAGADLDYLKTLQNNTYEENLADSRQLMTLFHTIYTHPKIVIAQVEGAAIAGGCGLATVCDFVFATPDTQFGYTEVRIGFIPAIVLVFLLRKIGEGRAKELLLSGKLIDSTNALSMGLINFIETTEDIAEKVSDFAQKMCEQASAESLQLTKTMIGQVQNMSLTDALNYAATQNANARATQDCKAGINAFLNKEKIVW